MQTDKAEQCWTDFLSSGSFIRPDHLLQSAWLEHAPFAFWLMDVLRPARFVELGTHYGYSFLAFCQANKHFDIGSSCYAVDTWVGDPHAGFYSDDIYFQLAGIVASSFPSDATLVRSTFDEARDSFADGSIDLLHIDGAHFYESVKADYETWRPKLSDRAVVLFHDTNVHERDFGVWRLWEELSAEHDGFEFRHGYGLGVLCVGPSAPDPLKRLAKSGEQTKREVRRAYAALGAAISTQYALKSEKAALRHETAALRQTNAQLQQDVQARDHSLRDAERRAKNFHEKTVRVQQTSALIVADLYRDLIARSSQSHPIARWLDASRHGEVPPIYLEDCQWRLQNTHFDSNWYTRTYKDEGINERTAARHYLEKGYLKGFHPNFATSILDEAWYLSKNPDVAASDMSAAEHFLGYGQDEERAPNEICVGFDEAWYRQEYADVDFDRQTALEHYVLVGRSQGRFKNAEAAAATHAEISSGSRFSGRDSRLAYAEASIARIDGAIDIERARNAGVVLYAIYSENNTLSPSCKAIARALRAAGYSIIIVNNYVSDQVDGKEAIKEFCDAYVQRNPGGRDFGAWVSIAHCMPDLSQANSVLLVNDSIIGPVADIGKVIEKFRASQCDLWGLTDSAHNGYHLQSSFLLMQGDFFRGSVFRRFIDGYDFPEGKREVIELGEIGLSRAALNEGARLGSLCPYTQTANHWMASVAVRIADIDREIGRATELPFFNDTTNYNAEAIVEWYSEQKRIILKGVTLNPQHWFWDLMVQFYGYPFLKRELFLKNPARIMSLYRLPSIVSPDTFTHLQQAFQYERETWQS